MAILRLGLLCLSLSVAACSHQKWVYNDRLEVFNTRVAEKPTLVFLGQSSQKTLEIQEERLYLFDGIFAEKSKDIIDKNALYTLYEEYEKNRKYLVFEFPHAQASLVYEVPFLSPELFNEKFKAVISHIRHHFHYR